MLVYNAVIVSQLIYGLESIPLTNQQEQKLDAFQQRGLRAIMKIDPSFISHETNLNVFAKANECISKSKLSIHDFRDIIISKDLQQAHIKPISEILALRRSKLLGHIIRRDNDDLLKQVTIRDMEAVRKPYRRVGRPRLHWMDLTLQETYYRITRQSFDKNNEDMKIEFYNHALARSF